MDLVDIALLFHGVPYDWAGNDKETGMDCSGFVLECLRSIGDMGTSDLTAQDMHFNLLSRCRDKSPQRNSLLFFGKDKNNITHVAIAINETQMIEAGGEGRTNTTKGYVRIRPISWRSDLVDVIDLI